MKTLRFIFVCFILPISFYSCKKDNEVHITGKWISQEYYNGYVDGGDFTWHSIDDQYKRTIEFTSDGRYFEATGFGSCNGTYTVTNHDIIINTSCGLYSSSFYFGLRTNILIFNNFVREGFVKIKYTKIN
jgi:hypothetical protein